MIILVGGSFVALAFQNINIGGFKRGSDHVLGMSLGLDLIGGINLVYQAGEPGGPAPSQDQMDGLVSIITRRINSLGVAEPSIQQLGSDRLVIQLPGLQNEEAAKSVIGKTAQLEIVERICLAYPCDSDHPENIDDRPSGLTGADMSSASPGTNTVTGKPILLFQLNHSASAEFAKLTQRIYNTQTTQTPDQLAFVLDGKVLVAAVVSSPITSGSGQIEGNFTTEDVRQLAIQIESGRLPVPVNEVSADFVAASLGADSLDHTVQAGIVGLILVLFFMIAYYRLSGVVAALALIFYTAMVLAIFKLLPVTLTLAGLAGFILSLGMAVDANILIFERMKEEIRVGRSLHFAAQIGFNRAWSSIRDGNVSTLLIAGILFFFGSSGANSAVTGFAVALSIGVVTSMFTAIVISKKMITLIVGTSLRKWPRAFSPEHYEGVTAERGA